MPWKKAKPRKVSKPSVRARNDRFDRLKEKFDGKEAGLPLTDKDKTAMAKALGAKKKMVEIFVVPELEPVRLPARSGKKTKMKLTDELANLICTALSKGAYRETAANWAGVTQSQLSDWLKQKGEPWETFQRAVERAESYAELNMLNAVQLGAYADAKHAITFLQMRYKKRWQPPAAPGLAGATVNFNLAMLLDQAEKEDAGWQKQRRDKYIDEDAGRPALPPAAVEMPKIDPPAEGG